MPKNIPHIFEKDIPLNETEAGRLAQKAKEALSDLTEAYLVQVTQDYKIMQDMLTRAYKTEADERFHLIRDDFFLKMHDLKGQGSTFGYPLLTEIGRFTCDFLRHKKEINTADLDLLKTVLADMDTVLKNNLTDTGGTMGNVIRNRLKKRENG